MHTIQCHLWCRTLFSEQQNLVSIFPATLRVQTVVEPPGTPFEEASTCSANVPKYFAAQPQNVRFPGMSCPNGMRTDALASVRACFSGLLLNVPR